jgi:hypothetical protein
MIIKVGQKIPKKTIENLKTKILDQILNNKLSPCRFSESGSIICEYYMNNDNIKGCVLIVFRDSLEDVKECIARDKQNVILEFF